MGHCALGIERHHVLRYACCSRKKDGSQKELACARSIVLSISKKRKNGALSRSAHGIPGKNENARTKYGDHSALAPKNNEQVVAARGMLRVCSQVFLRQE